MPPNLSRDATIWKRDGSRPHGRARLSSGGTVWRVGRSPCLLSEPSRGSGVGRATLARMAPGRAPAAAVGAEETAKVVGETAAGACPCAADTPGEQTHPVPPVGRDASTSGGSFERVPSALCRFAGNVLPRAAATNPPEQPGRGDARPLPARGVGRAARAPAPAPCAAPAACDHRVPQCRLPIMRGANGAGGRGKYAACSRGHRAHDLRWPAAIGARLPLALQRPAPVPVVLAQLRWVGGACLGHARPSRHRGSCGAAPRRSQWHVCPPRVGQRALHRRPTRRAKGHSKAPSVVSRARTGGVAFASGTRPCGAGARKCRKDRRSRLRNPGARVGGALGPPGSPAPGPPSGLHRCAGAASGARRGGLKPTAAASRCSEGPRVGGARYRSSMSKNPGRASDAAPAMPTGGGDAENHQRRQVPGCLRVTRRGDGAGNPGCRGLRLRGTIRFGTAHRRRLPPAGPAPPHAPMQAATRTRCPPPRRRMSMMPPSPRLPAGARTPTPPVSVPLTVAPRCGGACDGWAPLFWGGVRGGPGV